MTTWNIEADVVVAGSGGAGLTAAILAHDHGARVAVLERSDKIGGTTAVSGGTVWIPLNHHMAEAGAADTRDAALAYCRALARGEVADELVETFVDSGHRMVRYLEEHAALRLRPTSLPDYLPAIDGASRGGRSIEAELFDTNELGEWRDRLRPSPTYSLPLTLQETLFEYQAHIRPQDLPADLIAERRARGLAGYGNALVLALVPLWVGDSAAYFIGKSVGRRPLAPNISPNKTVEGSVANLIGCLIAAFAIGHYFNLPWSVPLAFGLSTGLFGQVGDLLQSKLKRDAGVKDSGSLLPGHGGVLDRLDSLLYSAPISLGCATLLASSVFHVKPL